MKVLGANTFFPREKLEKEFHYLPYVGTSSTALKNG